MTSVVPSLLIIIMALGGAGVGGSIGFSCQYTMDLFEFHLVWSGVITIFSICIVILAVSIIGHIIECAVGTN
jgi:hypothetical protein